MRHFLKRSLVTAIAGLCLSGGLLNTETAMASTDSDGVTMQLLKNDPGYTHLNIEFPTQIAIQDIMIDGEPFMKIGDIKGEAVSEHRAGVPQLPAAVRRLRIPNKSKMHVEVANAEFYEMQGIRLAPSKGPISRELLPEQVPYTFGDEYQKDEFWPMDVAQLGTPWIMRDQRGIDLKVTPFQYNPVTKVLRVYTKIELMAYAEGDDDQNTLPLDARSSNRLGWHDMFAETYLNWEPYDRPVIVPYNPEMLVITPEKWADEIQPLVDHHNDNGLWTVVRHIENIGNTPDEIRDYIANRYHWWGISYVLIVGDYDDVTTDLVNYASSTGGTDPTYGFISGNDHQPEVLVGRFSANTDADVVTQVDRTIQYENQLGIFNSWRNKALGVGSDDGNGGDDGELDWEHLDEIRDDLLASRFTDVAQVYEPAALGADVTNAIEANLGVINYTGHGSSTRWTTSGFDNGDVDALENSWRLPWIISVACVNGQFHNASDCFAERWLRATDDSGKPTGAVAAFMSTVNQHWDPPMQAQDVIGDKTAAGTIKRFGNLCAAGTASMVSAYGASGKEMIETWTIFGDPALNLKPRDLKLIQIYWPEWHLYLGQIHELDPRIMKLANDGDYPKLVELEWNVDWIHVEPSVLVIEPGEAAEVAIFADVTRAELEAGEHTASIIARDMTEGTADQGKIVRIDVVEQSCQGDLNGDGTVDITDLLNVLSQWGTCTSGCSADTNDDGTVDITDLLTVLAGWGSC